MGDRPDFSVQPPPARSAEAVSAHDLVVSDLLSLFRHVPDVELAVSAVQGRKQYGLRKYGVVLHHANGRDYRLDVEEELLDLVAYLRIFFEKHPDLYPEFDLDYLFLLRFLIRWRSQRESLQELEDSP